MSTHNMFSWRNKKYMYIEKVHYLKLWYCMFQAKQPIYPSPTRVEVQMKALETAYQSQTKRMTALEDTIQKLLTEFLVQLRESREENKFLRVS